MPVSKMLRLTEEQLHARVSARVRGAADPYVAAGAAKGIPGSQAGAGAGGSTQGGNDAAARAQGYVLMPYPISAPGVYRITDVETGRFYVGSSVNIANRWRQHQYRLIRGTHPNPILQALWNANPERVRIETIQHCQMNKEEILAAEQAALDAAGVGSNRMCMNVLPVAGSHLGRKRSAETLAAMSAAQLGRVHTEAAKAKMRAAKIGKPLSDEHRKKLGDAARGKKINRKKGGSNKLIRVFGDEQIIEMRKMKASGSSYSEIEAKHNVSHGGLQKIIQMQTYRDVFCG